MASQNLVLRGQIKRETEKALLISFTNGRESWVPKSVIYSDFSPQSDALQDFNIAKWFADKNNIILESSNPNILGQSGSAMYLKKRLLRKGIEGFETFEDIHQFKMHFSGILASSSKEEREKLNSVIEMLKTNEEKLVQQVKEKKAELKTSLLEEKEQLAEGELPSAKKRVKKIDKILNKKLDKPFKKELKQIKKTEKEITIQEKNIDKKVEKSVQPLRNARDIIEENKTFVMGAVGETAAIKELKKLPAAYFILNEAALRFSKAIRWGKHGQYVKSCKIDHVVVGPTGIFLIETKNWNSQRMTQAKFTPHEQIDRAGYIFFIHIMDKFNQKFPVFKIVATFRSLPIIPYKYVDQMTIRELVNFILKKPQSLDTPNIQKIVAWLRCNPCIYNLHFPINFRLHRAWRIRF